MLAVMPIRKPVARYQKMIVAGRAIVYRMRWVKLKRRKTLPRKPQIREATLT